VALFLVSPFIGAAGSIAGMTLELSGFLDDNLTIPLGSGIIMLVATLFVARVVI
jgi:dolichol kinase